MDIYRNVRLVTPEDPDYIAAMRRMADRRPSRGGPRSAGEMLGGIVERAIRHWLSEWIPLIDERIVAWEQRVRTGRTATLYREVDAIWQIDAESLCLFEMKLTHAENMERGVGLRQLSAAAETLLAAPSNRYVLKRLTYVSAEPVTVLDGLPELGPDDEYEELGVVWVPPEAIEAAAAKLELDLPDDWLSPEAREGVVTDPEREEWRQYSDTGESNAGADPDSPLARALKQVIDPK
jgi:hypothetical protein